MKKKITTLLMAGMVMATITGCGAKKSDDAMNSGMKSGITEEKKSSSVSDDQKDTSSQSSTGEEKQSGFKTADEVLNKVLASYKKDQLFPIEGGNVENPVMDKAGLFDIAKTEELDMFLGLPKQLADRIDGAASMIHQLNANTFTSAAYHVKEGTDMKDFVKEMQEHLVKKQWVCGAPDTFLAIQADSEYVITVFGKKDLTDVFKENTATAIPESKVLLEEALVQ